MKVIHRLVVAVSVAVAVAALAYAKPPTTPPVDKCTSCPCDGTPLGACLVPALASECGCPIAKPK